MRSHLRRVAAGAAALVLWASVAGAQDMGGKQGGQAGFPKPVERPHSTKRDEDVVPKRDEGARRS